MTSKTNDQGGVKLSNLSGGARKLLGVIARKPALVPYGDPFALELIHQNLARRSEGFGKLKITKAGLSALTTGEDQ